MTWTDKEVIGALLAGDSRMFGMRVELSWPDGLPPGMTEEDLCRLGGDMAPRGERPEWIRADAGRCEVPVTCGHLLKDGKCDIHGKG